MNRLVFSGLVLISLIFASCSQSNDVVQNGLISKRKYRKGFHIESFKKKQSKTNIARMERKNLPKHSYDAVLDETDKGSAISSLEKPSKKSVLDLALNSSRRSDDDQKADKKPIQELRLALKEVKTESNVDAVNAPSSAQKQNDEFRKASRSQKLGRWSLLMFFLQLVCFNLIALNMFFGFMGVGLTLLTLLFFITFFILALRLAWTVRKRNKAAKVSFILSWVLLIMMISLLTSLTFMGIGVFAA